MSQEHVEIVIGRLLTDEAFRRAFLQWPLRTIHMLEQLGLEFTETEVTALLSTDRRLWPSVALRLDPRLQHDDHSGLDETAEPTG